MMALHPKRSRLPLSELPPLDDDPLSGLANLFDAAIVFALALMVALAIAQQLPLESLAQTAAVPQPETARPVPMRPSERVAGGSGTRVGVAYRLHSGELVYVPDPASQEVQQ